jgi:hypothetical protein
MIVRNRLSGKSSYSTTPQYKFFVCILLMPESGARRQKFRFSSFRGNRPIRRGSSLNPNVGFSTREALNDELVGNRFAGNRE